MVWLSWILFPSIRAVSPAHPLASIMDSPDWFHLVCCQTTHYHTPHIIAPNHVSPYKIHETLAKATYFKKKTIKNLHNFFYNLQIPLKEKHATPKWKGNAQSVKHIMWCLCTRHALVCGTLQRDQRGVGAMGSKLTRKSGITRGHLLSACIKL